MRNIYLALGIETTPDLQRELMDHVRWCREKGLLPEYVAGSKGAYRRALMKRFIRNSEHPARTILTGLQKPQLIDADWQDLYGHIVAASRGQTDYYRNVYGLSRVLIQKKDEEWVSFSRKIVTAMLGKILAEEGSTDAKTFLREEPDNMAEYDLMKLGVRVKNGSSGVGGWVDRDALAIFDQAFDHDPEWHLAPEELVVQRKVEDSAQQDAHLYEKFGIRIKADSHSRTCYACIDTFDVPRTWTDDYTDEVMPTEEAEALSTE